MKKIYLSILAGFAGLTTLAQPTLNISSWNNGTSFGLYGDLTGGTILPSIGAAGANQTWDFSTLSFTKVADYSFKASSATPHAAEFPNAPLAAEIIFNVAGSTFTLYGFYDVTSEGLIIYGQRSAFAGDKDYTTPELTIPLGLAYNQTKNSTYQETGGSVISKSFKYDAYGTLTVGGSTYSNVIRFEVTDGGDIAYEWYNSTNGLPLMNVEQDGSDPQYFGNAVVSNVTENVKNTSLNVYPNPVVNQAKISFEINEAEQMEVVLLDMTGKQVLEIANRNFSAGIHTLSFANQNLQNGVYFVNIKSGNQNITKRVVLAK